MAERLQKVLAAAGVASRREAEQWIRAGRVTVNERPVVLGQRVEETDRIAIDGRRVRRERAAPADLVLIYHRSPGESLRSGTPGAEVDPAASTYERLPSVRGRRWLPLSPLAPTDGGLEVFTTDGELRAAAGRVAQVLASAYAVRIAGEPSEQLVAGLRAAAAAAEPPFTIDAVGVAGGEGRNRWLEFEVRGARGRDLRALLLAQGFEVNRILRTRFGPVKMDRAISRGRHRELTPVERDALYDALGLTTPGKRSRTRVKAGSRSAGPSRRKRPGPAGKGRLR
jgi:23S rRNA pseudouridine2605 synthase